MWKKKTNNLCPFNFKHLIICVHKEIRKTNAGRHMGRSTNSLPPEHTSFLWQTTEDQQTIKGRKPTSCFSVQACIPCCPVVCWGCAQHWVSHRWPWPFGKEQSGSFCAHGLHLAESHCAWTCKKKQITEGNQTLETNHQLFSNLSQIHEIVSKQPDQIAELHYSMITMFQALLWLIKAALLPLFYVIPQTLSSNAYLWRYIFYFLEINETSRKANTCNKSLRWYSKSPPLNSLRTNKKINKSTFFLSKWIFFIYQPFWLLPWTSLKWFLQFFKLRKT